MMALYEARCRMRVLAAQVSVGEYVFGVLQWDLQTHGGFGLGELELGKPLVWPC